MSFLRIGTNVTEAEQAKPFIALAKELGLILTAPFLMKLDVRPSGREPDIIFIAREHSALLKNVFLDGPADLAVEVVSPDSQTRDRRDKFHECHLKTACWTRVTHPSGR